MQNLLSVALIRPEICVFEQTEKHEMASSAGSKHFLDVSRHFLILSMAEQNISLIDKQEMPVKM